MSHELPGRYEKPWKDAFIARALSNLGSEAVILDMGSGRKPIIPRSHRPTSSTYVGLDISESELRLAPDGSYDELVAADITERMPSLENRFDLIVSWQVLEHVRSLDASLDNARAYLRPGGRLVARLSGKYSAFGVINTIVPDRWGPVVLERLLNRPRGTVFPAYYHHCWHSQIVRDLEPWSTCRVESDFRGASYWGFSPLLQRLYLMYENWAARNGRNNLATHYLIDAIR